MLDGVYSHKSDVWMMAVLMWGVFDYNIIMQDTVPSMRVCMIDSCSPSNILAFKRVIVASFQRSTRLA